MQPTEPLFDTLATAAFHGERVAARRLATRSQQSEAQALLEVLTQAAAAAGLADLSALLAARGVAKQIDADRRAGRRAEQAARLAHKKAQLAPPSDRWRGWFPLVVTRVTSTARHIPTARRTTATGRSPGSRINAGARRLPRSRSGRSLPDRQWRMTRGLAAYSCGNSRSFTLRSLLIPFRGT